MYDTIRNTTFIIIIHILHNNHIFYNLLIQTITIKQKDKVYPTNNPYDTIIPNQLEYVLHEVDQLKFVFVYLKMNALVCQGYYTHNNQCE